MRLQVCWLLIAGCWLLGCRNRLNLLCTMLRTYTTCLLVIVMAAMDVEVEDEKQELNFAAVGVYPKHISCHCNIFDHNLALNDGRD
jgi:hypothetical protein